MVSLTKNAESTPDTASLGPWHVLYGSGLFDVAFDRPNREGWHIYEAGQRQFWAVAGAVDASLKG